MVILTPRVRCNFCGSKARVEQTENLTDPYEVKCSNDKCDAKSFKAPRVADAISHWNYENQRDCNDKGTY